MNNLISNIKGHHFTYGNNVNDFSTTTGQTYKYDRNEAHKAKGVLEEGLKQDLRASHCRLGYNDGNNFNTTHQTTYVPQNIDMRNKAAVSSELRKNHFNFANNGKFNEKTIYMVDYTKKELD